MRFFYGPRGWGKRKIEVLENTLQHGKRGLCCHSPPLFPEYGQVPRGPHFARQNTALLQGLHTGHQPAARAAFGFGHVPDFPERAGAGRRLLADHAGELHAGHVFVRLLFDAQ